MEKIIEIKVCKYCNSNFDITDKDLEFYEKISPVFPQNGELSSKNGEIRKLIKPLSSKFSALNSFKYLIQLPTLCPDCRQQRRMSWRNERALYKRNCYLSGKSIVSMYSPDKLYQVYDQDVWWSDKWNAMGYGKSFGFNKNFFEQFGELLKEVPRLSIMNKQSENSDYCNYSFQNKNNYLTFGSHYEEGCMYGNYSTKNNFCLDCFWLYESELCYECMYSGKCYNCIYLDHCEDCEGCYFSINLKGCKNCFLCSGLVGKQYCILNKQYSKEDYYDKLKHYNFGIYSEFQNLIDYFLNDLYKKFPLKEGYKINSENCLGNNFQNCKNMFDIFNSSDSEDCRYGAQVDGTYDSMDMNFIGYDKSELCYEFIGCLGLYNCKFCNACWNNDSLIYCDFCFNSSNLFGCVGLKNKSYCILNKQYEKSEYEKLVPKIIEHMMKTGEWGEFFPSSLSPFGYNETVAMEYFPLNRFDVIPANAGIYSNEKQLNLTKDTEISKSNCSKEYSKSFRELIDSGSSQEGQTPAFIHGPIFNRSTYESPKPKVKKIIPASKLPEDIKEIPDDILNRAIKCEVSGKPFRIIKEELDFYRKHNLPIPKRHPDQRHLDRMKLRNPRKLYDRLCDCKNCEENNKKAGTFKQEDFALKDSPIKLRTGSELNSGGQRRKIKTTYSNESEVLVYCDECYNKEVY